MMTTDKSALGTDGNQETCVFWFRQDLRLNDNPGLTAALETDLPVILLYVLDDETPGPWSVGGAGRWWLHHSLTALSAEIAALGGRLILRRGRAGDVVTGLVDEVRASHIFWNRCYEPFAVKRDKALKADLQAKGKTVQSANSSLLFEPWQIRNKSGNPFKVFTPFWKACLAAAPPPEPLAKPTRLIGPSTLPESNELDDWRLLPTQPNWAGGLVETWTPGEDGAHGRLDEFLANTLSDYTDGRDHPDRQATSMLSPHLHFGEISPRIIWHTAHHRSAANGSGSDRNSVKFLSEIGWREFSYSLLYYNQDLPDSCLRTEFNHFPWAQDDSAFKAWQQGMTGYPIVDAGMRQLWHTGWMHNRVRMIAASFLIKDLLIPWQEGAAWFWDTLVDADLASNSASWQWVAGCGADAAPYFRIFNPVLQGRKFDSKGNYVRHWVPELRGLPDGHIHEPWAAPEAVLAECGVELGQSYPRPIVDHAQARQLALKSYETVKANAA